MIRVLTKMIADVVESENSNLKFDSYQKIWFDKDRVINTSRNQDGSTFWETKNGTLQPNQPEEAQKIQGRSAIVRHLLTKLCRYLSGETLQGEDSELLLTFVREMTRSSKAYKAFSKTEDFDELHIERDMNALMRFAKGEAKAGDFSRFTEGNSGSGWFGGGRGYGGGGGGGVF